MNNFRKKMVYLQCCSKQAADMLRKQPCLVRTENLDNSLYTRTKTEVVHPTVYYCIHSASAGWVSTYTHWCELIFHSLCTGSPEPSEQNEIGSHLFCA